MNLAAIDLNLLVALEALLTERNVTRAASKVGLTQPAMSHALSRLRDLLGDSLLVRTSDGMVPTARARELENPLRSALEQIRASLAPPAQFNPAQSQMTFTVSTPDIGQFCMIPRLLERLKAKAPGINLVVDARYAGFQPKLLEAGEVDIIMAPEQDVPGGFYKQKGLDVFQVCIVRQGHPEVGKRLTIKEFLSIPHVMVNIPGTDVSGIDQALAAKGLSRRIAVRVPSFLAVPWIIAKSDLIAVLPDMLVDQVGPLLPVAAHPMPLPAPQLAVFMYWHERTNNSPAHQWMRSQISELAAEMEHSLTFRKAG